MVTGAQLTGAFDGDGVFGAIYPANIAPRAKFGVDLMPTIRRQWNRVRRAMLGADGAASAFVLYDISNQRLAAARRTTTGNVRFVFVAEIPERGQNRIWRGAT